MLTVLLTVDMYSSDTPCVHLKGPSLSIRSGNCHSPCYMIVFLELFFLLGCFNRGTPVDSTINLMTFDNLVHIVISNYQLSLISFLD